MKAFIGVAAPLPRAIIRNKLAVVEPAASPPPMMVSRS